MATLSLKEELQWCEDCWRG